MKIEFQRDLSTIYLSSTKIHKSIKMPKDVVTPADETERTLFVNGLSYESTEEDIRYFFEGHGSIDKINLPKYQDSKRNIGYCHVTFETKEEAEEALKQLDGKYLDKRYLKIEWAQGGRSKTCKIRFHPSQCQPGPNHQQDCLHQKPPLLDQRRRSRRILRGKVR